MALAKAYNAADYEQKIWKLWEDSGQFQPAKHGEPYSIILPPPNATGQLHLGHAAMLAIEDALIRYKRMNGYAALWLPGTDHAAIATNAVMERELEKEGKTKHDLGREKFLEKLAEYVEQSRGTIRSQIRAMGASVDWSRERYTMEPAMHRIINEVFVKMYKDGLIYRGHRIVNWDPKLETTVSDDEVEYQEEKTTLYTLKYGPFEIATSRPETKFGDKYVVMHPDDKRYEKYKHGDTFDAEWINGRVKATVIKDESIDPDFGTGVMTITPWHDPVDFDIATKHELDKQQIIDLSGRLLEIAGDFAGQEITEARPKIVELLKKKGLVVSENSEYIHRVAKNSRGGGTIEPQIMLQWFVDVNTPAVKWNGKKHTLKEVMTEVVKSKQVEIIPEKFDKIYFNWIDNLRDWCISRQIWWGHRIPAWYRPSKEQGGESEIFVGMEPPEGEGWIRDEDTLDTWFSSAMWTWSTLIDRDLAENSDKDLQYLLKHSPDFNRFHPTSVLETGYDIIFFWVARMILMTTYVTEQIPFKTVFLHGLIRTRDGKKMSKSIPESAIDPLEIIPKYGADALRLSLLFGLSPGNDMRIYDEKIAGQRNFCNKLWNVARYALGTLPEGYKPGKVRLSTPADYWIHNKLQQTITTVSSSIEKYRLSDAVQTCYQFLWNDFADWYVEASKKQPNNDLLVKCLETILKLTHPFAPFVTEAIWQEFAWTKGNLMVENWPKEEKIFAREAKDFEKIQEIVSEIRNLCGELQLTETNLYHKGNEFLRLNGDLITHLTDIQGVNEVVDGHGLHLTALDGESWLDVEEQITRNYLFKLVRRRDESKKLIVRIEQRLSNADYLNSAPKEVVEESKNDLISTQETISKLDRQIKNLERELELFG